MTKPLKAAALVIILLTALNIYQYTKINALSSSLKAQVNTQLSESIFSAQTEASNATIAVLPVPKPETGQLNIQESHTSAAQTDNAVTFSSETDYSDAFFEYELSRYLNDDVVKSLKNSDSRDKLKVINMLNNIEVREQDIDLESKFSQLFDRYIESIQSGSEKVSCNSLGCYSSYVLTDPKAQTHMFIDYPNLGGYGFGLQIVNIDGTKQYVNFDFYE